MGERVERETKEIYGAEEEAEAQEEEEEQDIL
jgi:hypothetical protein